MRTLSTPDIAQYIDKKIFTEHDAEVAEIRNFFKKFLLPLCLGLSQFPCRKIKGLKNRAFFHDIFKADYILLLYSVLLLQPGKPRSPPFNFISS